MSIVSKIRAASIPTHTDLPQGAHVEECNGYLTLVESRCGPIDEYDEVEITRIPLGHVSSDPESEVPDYYRRGHRIYRAIERMSEEYLDAIFGDDYRAEHEHTFRLGQTGGRS